MARDTPFSLDMSLPGHASLDTVAFSHLPPYWTHSGELGTLQRRTVVVHINHTEAHHPHVQNLIPHLAAKALVGKEKVGEAFLQSSIAIFKASLTSVKISMDAIQVLNRIQA